MTIADHTKIQAYRLNAGGARARMAILRMIAADMPRTGSGARTWRHARAYRLDTYEKAFGMPSIGRTGKAPVLVTHWGPEFRDEREAWQIRRSLPMGYYRDVEYRAEVRGIVARLPHGRYIAGTYDLESGERAHYPKVYDEESDAAHAADGHAEYSAEMQREDDERFQTMMLAELDAENKVIELQKAFALRHRAKFGGVSPGSRGN